VHINLSLESVESEAALVARSRLLSDDLEIELLNLCRNKFTIGEQVEVQRTLSFARSLKPCAAGYPSLLRYLAHPLRVAICVTKIQVNPRVETVRIALLHNVFEVCGLKEEDLMEAGFSRYVAQAIRLLTIDRTLEEDHEYLKMFYDKIEAFDDNLSLVRVIDKLDNLLSLDLCEDDDTRCRYIHLAALFVTPMAYRLSSELGQYFEAVIAFVRKRTEFPQANAEMA
jgi:(p)ppGpp synthase/HD superfamily hydrolase